MIRQGGFHVGLTGGLASGKSFVGSILGDLGCYVIHADELGHQAMEPGAEAYDGIVREFGSAILVSDGTIDRRKPIDRRKLGSIAFSDPALLDRLNALVHPAVRARARSLEDAFFAQHPDGIAVTEAAILIETGSYKNYARLVVAVCRPEEQIERAMKRDGLSRQEVLNRLQRQMPLDEKLKYADYVVDTSGSKDATREQTRVVYESLRALQAAA